MTLPEYFKDQVHPTRLGGELIAQKMMCVVSAILRTCGTSTDHAPQKQSEPAIPPALYAPSYAQRHCWTTLGEPHVRNLEPLFNDGGWEFISRTDVYPTGKNGWGCTDPDRRMTLSIKGCARQLTLFYLQSYDVGVGAASVRFPGCPSPPTNISAFNDAYKIRIAQGRRINIPSACHPPSVEIVSMTRAAGNSSMLTSNATLFQVIALGCD